MTSARARSDVDDLTVRDALVAAVETARAELAHADRAALVPRPLIRIAGFRNLSKAALAQVRRIVDVDEEFRARVASTVDSSDVDEPSWLFLHRPDGWSERLRGFAATQATADGHDTAEPDRATPRRLKAAEAARDRALQRLSAAEHRLESALAELEGERAARAQLAADMESMSARLTKVDHEAQAMATRVRAAEGRQAEAGHRVEQVSAARDQLRAQRDELRAERDELRTELDQLRTERDELRIRVTAERVPRADQVEPAVADAIAAAAAAAGELAASLAEAAAALRSPGAPVASTPPRAPDQPAAPTDRASSASAPRSGGRRSAVRSPLPLPPGVFDDSTEAAEHLVAVPEVVLLVDGYNASIGRWPELAIEEQRRRLLAAVTELHARCGVTVRVVFDGVEPASRHLATSARGVSVTFTDEGTEADDVILEWVASSGDRPVVVASDDRRVRRGAEGSGANVLSLDQLFSVLRRES